MLNSISFRRFLGWQLYTRLKPLDAVHWQLALIAQTIWNANFKEKQDLDKFMLFREAPEKTVRRQAQTPEFIEREIDAWVFVSNEAMRKKQARG